MKYDKDVPAVTWTAHFFCNHPWEQRRQYAGVEVCRECCSARTTGGYWDSAHRLNCSDGSLRTTAGVILYRNWNWSRQR